MRLSSPTGQRGPMIMRYPIRRSLVHALAVTGCFAASTAASEPPAAAVRLTRLPETGFAAGVGADVSAKENQFSAELFRHSSGDWRWDFGLDYQYTRYEYAAVPSRNRDLHRVQLPAAFNGRRGRWSVGGYIALGVSTSSNVIKDPFERLGSDDLYVAGRLELRYPGDSPDGWLLGLRYDRALGSPAVYPVLGRDYRVTAGLTARLAFPDPALRYVDGDRHRWLLRAFPAGHRWHVVTDDFAAGFDYEVEAWRAELAYGYRVAGPVWIDAVVGYEWGRAHRFRDDALVVVDAGADDAWLAGIALRWGDAPLPATHGTQL